jgi:large repetitive protein
MRARLLLFLFLLAFAARSQSYSVQCTLTAQNDGSCSGGGNSCSNWNASANLKLASGGPVWISDGTSTFTVNSKPTGVNLFSQFVEDFEGTIVNECSANDGSDFTSYEGCYTNTFTWGQCAWGELTITIRPILGISGPAAGSFCSTSGITLTATSGFNQYHWYAVLQSGTVFVGTSGSNPTFELNDVPGLSQGQSFYFYYTVGSCNHTVAPSTASPSYTFVPALSATFNTTKPICPGGSDGAVSIASYSRAELDGEDFAFELHTNNVLHPSSLVTNLSALTGGVTYYAFVYSTLGNCSLTPLPVLVPDGPRTPVSATASIISNFNGAQISCSGANDGVIQISASGGLAPYQFNFDNTGYQVGNTFTTGAGSHNVMVKDACSTANTYSLSAQLTAPSALGISTVTPSLCNTANGTISITPSGGTGPYFSSSDNGATYVAGNSLTVLSGYSYPVRIKDSNNCSFLYGSVSVPAELTSSLASPIHPICTGSNQGGIIVTSASGGQGALTFAVAGYGTQSIGSAITGISGTGPFSVTVSDANNCTVPAGSVSINLPITVGYSATPESCVNKGDGQLIVSASGGTNTFTFAANTGAFQASPTLSGLANSNSHVIKIRDGSVNPINSSTCELTISNAIVPLRNPISPAISQTANIACYNDNTAALNLTPGSGWSTPYSYLWRKNTFLTGITTEDISGIGAGDYEVTITDAVGCSINATKTVTQPTQVAGSFSIPTTGGFAIACKGDASGSVNLTPSGGTPGYSFLWYKNDASIGTTTEDISSLSAGNYKVRITDANNCVITTANQTLSEPANAVAVSLNSTTDVNCFGQSTGGINVAGTAGVGSLQYKLEGGTFSMGYQVSSSFIGLPVDNYIVTAKDDNGCTKPSTIISVTGPASAVGISEIVKANPTCNGAATGSLNVSPQGGTAPYTYRLNGGGTVITDPLIQNLSAGDHVVQVVDSKNCSITSATQTLINPPLIAFGTVTISPQSCAAVVDGSINTSASGGTGVIQYSINGTTYQGTGTFTGLSANSYTVTARDANLCTKTASLTVGTAPAVNGTITQTAFINCYGESTAALNIAGSGGTGPYTYVWSNSATTSSITSLPAAAYSVDVTDSKGCAATKNLTVSQPALLTITPSSSNYNGFGVSCPLSTNGFINLTINGGTAGYTYSWSNGASIRDISSLAEGTYSVTVTDSKSCIATSDITITAPTAVSASVSSKTDVSCNGGANGSVQLAALGGTGLFEFSKNAGANWQSSNIFSGLTSGPITIHVRDQNSCLSQTNVTISQPAAISASTVNIQNTTCGQSNGSAEATASGGTGSYSYSWTNSLSQVVGNANILNGIPSGSYSVTVTDENSCTGSALAIINASNGAQFNVTSVTPTKCYNSNDGAAQVSITSGQGPYTITWSSGETGSSSLQLSPGNNTVSVLDGNSCTTVQSFVVPSPAAIAIASQTLTAPTCPGTSTAGIEVLISGGTSPYSYSWNSIAGTNTLSNISPGTYQLKVVDSESCQLDQNVTVNDLSPITVSAVSMSTPTCHSSSDGVITVQAEGGNGGFTFTWPDLTTGAQHTSLGAGDYIITAKDSRDCIATSTLTLNEPSAVTVNVTKDEPSCNGGSDGTVTASGNGGTGAYSFSINGGNSWQTENVFDNLMAQSYDLSIRDGNGCSASASLVLTEPTVISIVPAVVHTTCGQNNGSISTAISGGTGTYTYSWANGFNQVVASTSTLASSAPDSYTLTVIDENQCIASVTVAVNASPLSDFQVINTVSTSCVDSSDGQASVQILSGPAPYSYTWSSNETASSATKLVAGANTVSVTDGNNCVVQKTFQITPPEDISLSAEVITQVTCPGTATGSIQVLATGGSAPYTYSWNGNTGLNQLQNLSPGSYTLTVIDSKGCDFVKSIIVPDIPAIVITGTTTPPTCFDGSDASVVVSASGGNGSFGYLWNNGTMGSTIQNISAGIYSVMATDMKGCSQPQQFTVLNPAKLIIDVGTDKIVCPGQALIFDPNISAASYLWTGPNGYTATSSGVNSATPGQYTLKIVDAKGCTAEDSFVLSVSEKLLKADLLMVSEAHARDTIIVIDISWPIPDNVSWDFDNGSKVIESTKDYALIKYEDPGVYTVTLNASLAGCQSAYMQNVTILKERDSQGGRKGDDRFGFISYSVHPNPFRDAFELNAELTHAAPLSVQLINVASNKAIFEDTLDENLTHQKAYSSSELVSGVYVLVIRSRDEIKSVRLLKL